MQNFLSETLTCCSRVSPDEEADDPDDPDEDTDMWSWRCFCRGVELGTGGSGMAWRGVEKS